MILYGRYDSPFVRRVAVSLHHYGLPFERCPLSVYDDFEALLSVNPLGKAPALDWGDGEVLFDSTAILDALEEKAAPERRLVPPSGATRRAVLRLTFLTLGLAEKAVALSIERNRRAPGKSDPAWAERLERQIARGLAWLEQQQPAPWFTPLGLTQAEVTTAVTLAYLREKHPTLYDGGDYAHLKSLSHEAEAVPAFRAAPYQES